MVRAVPFQLITEVLIKLVPLAVKVNVALPAVALVGDKLVNDGSGLLAVTVNTTAALVPPPGSGVNTVTGTEPAVARLAAGTSAVN